MSNLSEYAEAGVDPGKITGFKQLMQFVGAQTMTFPNRRGVFVEAGAHGAIWQYRGPHDHAWCGTKEGLGNKNWIAEWMYQNDPAGGTRYGGIGIDTALMAVNDVIAQGGMPVVYADEVAAGDSDWFADDRRGHDLAMSFLSVCQEVGMALPAGESPALKYLIKSELPVKSAPVLSGYVTGLIAPSRRRLGRHAVRPGDAIIGVTSSGAHSNGSSLIIKRALTLPDQFLTKLPNGNTLGDEALIPTRSYVALVEALLEKEIRIRCFLPGTGGGVSKLAVDSRPLTYRVHSWVKNIPPLFLFMQSLGVLLPDLLTTFNWGVGYYIFVPPDQVDMTLSIGALAGYKLELIGRVEEGERQVIFEPEGITLPPPGE